MRGMLWQADCCLQVQQLAMKKLDQISQSAMDRFCAAVAEKVVRGFNCCQGRIRHERAINQRSRVVDQVFSDQSAAKEDGTATCKSFAEGMQSDSNLVFEPEFADEPSSSAPEQASCMRFVDNQMAVPLR